MSSVLSGCCDLAGLRRQQTSISNGWVLPKISALVGSYHFPLMAARASSSFYSSFQQMPCVWKKEDEVLRSDPQLCCVWSVWPQVHCFFSEAQFLHRRQSCLFPYLTVHKCFLNTDCVPEGIIQLLPQELYGFRPLHIFFQIFFFWCGPFLKSFFEFNCFCFMFLVFLATRHIKSQLRDQESNSPPALEGSLNHWTTREGP